MTGESFTKLGSQWDKLVNDLRLNRIRRYWFELLNFVATTITICMFFVAALRAKVPEIWYVIILLVYLGVAVVLIITQHFFFSRKAKYSEAIKVFHPISHILRDGYYNIENMEQADFEVALAKILDALSAAFERVTGTKVRACIKQLEVDGTVEELQGIEEPKRSEKIYAEIFAVDSHSDWPQKRPADYPDDLNRLSRNSAFCAIFKGDSSCYIENNIPLAYKRHKYESSSFARYGHDQPGTYKWALPYKSTMIWPIRKIINERGDGDSALLIRDHDIFGFLCVDSESRYVWEPRFDRELGAAVADMLFAFINAWKNRSKTGPEVDKPSSK